MTRWLRWPRRRSDAVRRWLDGLERATLILGSTAMALLAIAVATFVFLRYLFGVSPFWSEEIVRIFLMVAVFLGAAISVRGRRHIRVEFLALLLPAQLRRLWYLFLDIVILGLFGLLVVTGVEAVGFNHSARTVALQVPISTIIWLVPAAFAVAAVFLVEEIAKSRREAG